MNRLVLAGAFLSALGLLEAAPAEANGSERSRPVYKGLSSHGLTLDRHYGARPIPLPGTFGPVKHHGRGYVHHRDHWHYGSLVQPVTHIRRSRPATRVIGLLAGYVSVGNAEPAWSIATTIYGLAPVNPICGSHAAPIGEHGVVYNRPLCLGY
jgi:hypothetical protein